MTAVTSAIRVGGNRDLKSLIGRAEEPDAIAEIELLRYVPYSGVSLLSIRALGLKFFVALHPKMFVSFGMGWGWYDWSERLRF